MGCVWFDSSWFIWETQFIIIQFLIICYLQLQVLHCLKPLQLLVL